MLCYISRNINGDAEAYGKYNLPMPLVKTIYDMAHDTPWQIKHIYNYYANASQYKTEKIISYKHKYMYVATPKVASRSIIQAILNADDKCGIHQVFHYERSVFSIPASC